MQTSDSKQLPQNYVTVKNNRTACAKNIRKCSDFKLGEEQSSSQMSFITHSWKPLSIEKDLAKIPYCVTLIRAVRYLASFVSQTKFAKNLHGF